MARERAACGDHDAAEALAGEARDAARAAGDRVLEAAAAVTVADAAHCRLRRDDPAALAGVDRKIAEAGALVDALPDEEVAERLQMLLWLFIVPLFHGRPRRRPRGGRARPRGGPPHGAGPARRGVSVPRHGRLGDGLASGRRGGLRGSARERTGLRQHAPRVSGRRSILARVALARGRIEPALAHGQAAWELLGRGPVLAGRLHTGRRPPGRGGSPGGGGGAGGVRLGQPGPVDPRPRPGGRRGRAGAARAGAGGRGGRAGPARPGRGRRPPHGHLRRHPRPCRGERLARPG